MGYEQMLKRFYRISLEPKEINMMTFLLNPADRAILDDKMK